MCSELFPILCCCTKVLFFIYLFNKRPEQQARQFSKIRSSQDGLVRQDRENGKIRKKDDGESSGTYHQKQPYKHYPLTFFTLQKMMAEDAEPHIIAQKFAEENTGLHQFLETNSANWEAIEVVMSVIGIFCQKKGVAKFHNAFIRIVQMLAGNSVFTNLDSTILHIPKSRSTNLGAKGERLSRLIKSISYLTTEMLTVMPALTCDYLGEKFFEDLSALKNIPSIRDTNVSKDFDFFEKEGALRLKVCTVAVNIRLQRFHRAKYLTF